MCFESLLKLTTFACSEFGYPELLKACEKAFQEYKTYGLPCFYCGFVKCKPNCLEGRNRRQTDDIHDLLFKPEWLTLSLKALKAILDFNVYQKNQEQLLLAVKRWEEANSELVTDSEMAEVYGKICFPCIRISKLKEIMKESDDCMPQTTKILLWIIKCKRIMKTYSTQSNIENEEKMIKSDNESVGASD